jgi:hypothetical protein
VGSSQKVDMKPTFTVQEIVLVSKGSGRFPFFVSLTNLVDFFIAFTSVILQHKTKGTEIKFTAGIYTTFFSVDTRFVG